jgi:hypothetical protein
MTCRSRSSRLGVAIFGTAIFSATFIAVPAALAADLPPIRTSETNKVAACATPGRLMAYVRERNPNLNARYDTLAGEYARHGDALKVRWDYAFFQMLLETGYLKYGGDVKPDQNNFAGLGATGRGARGERFPDISTGARAHIEHLVMYSGEHLDNPVAERTRNIQEWGVLTDWQKSVTGPITFSQLAKQWAPTSRRYGSDIEAIANRFFDGICKQPDPSADLVAQADAPPAVEKPAAQTPGRAAKERAVEEAKAEGGAQRTALGAPIADATLRVQGAAEVAAASEAQTQAQVKAEPETQPVQKAALIPPLKILNAEPEAEASAPADAAVATAPADQAPQKAEKQKTGKSVEVAALPGGAIKSTGKQEKAEKKPEKKKDAGEAAAAAPAPSGKCRVWTASYGGSKAIIIKAVQEKTVNYTVLDVNEGTEKREADAYINAYAKGGQSVGEFTSQSQALEKAFELCPEG